MQSHFIIFNFVDVITSLFLEIGLHVLVDDCDLIVLFLVFDDLVYFGL